MGCLGRDNTLYRGYFASRVACIICTILIEQLHPDFPNCRFRLSLDAIVGKTIFMMAPFSTRTTQPQMVRVVCAAGTVSRESIRRPLQIIVALSLGVTTLLRSVSVRARPFLMKIRLKHRSLVEIPQTSDTLATTLVPEWERVVFAISQSVVDCSDNLRTIFSF